MKTIKTSIIIFLIAFLSGSFSGYYVFRSKDEITIGQPSVSNTIYKRPDLKAINAAGENCEELAKLYNSEMWINGNYVNGTLTITAGDAGKSIKGSFPIYQRLPHKHILQGEVGYQYHKASLFISYGISYFYNFGRLSIGGGLIASQETIGAKAAIQINF